MAYRDWSNADYRYFQEEAWTAIYNEIPSVPYLDEDTDDEAREAFEKGWLTFDEYSPEEIYSFRQTFFDLTYMPENLFNSLGFWREYRELYNEVDAG